MKDKDFLINFITLIQSIALVHVMASILRNTANGQVRTLYSLRHSAITFRLLYGQNVDLLTLARNARTSVEMVERFYSSNLSAEMNIEQLQK